VNPKKSFSVLLIIALHLAIGILVQTKMISMAFNILLFIFGFLMIVKSKNRNQEALLWSAYIVGSEVLFRMTKGLIFHEFPKYMVMVFLVAGMFVERKKHKASPIFLMYILMLFIGIAFSDIPYPEPIRKNITFNLSGPVLLGLSAIYFYGRKISISVLLRALFYLTLPIISIVSLLYFRTPSLKEIVFASGANFETSGGYGPNQVSTILGVGLFALVAHILLKKKFSTIIFIDILLLTYIFYRNLLTFSRGGLVTAILAILFFGVLIIYSRKDHALSFVKYIGIGVLFILSIGIYTSGVTGGMLENRYANKNSAGEEKADITTGRLTILNTELDAFYENPIFGMGVGTGKYRRLDSLGELVASHNEVSRLLGEHGLIGLLILMLLMITPLVNAWNQPIYAKAFLGAFYIFWFLTINHSAMRLSFPGFIYGLSLVTITLHDQSNLKPKLK